MGFLAFFVWYYFKTFHFSAHTLQSFFSKKKDFRFDWG